MAIDPTAQPNPAALPLLGTINAPGAAQQAVTAAQLQSLRDYAAALMAQSMKQPDLRNPYAYSWAQGAGHIVEALVGGKLSHEADVREAQARAAAAQAATPTFGAPPGPSGARAESDETLPPVPVAPTASAGGPGDLDRYASAISKLESGGNYGELGPVTRTGDRAYGKYQVMGANVPEWTQAALGKRMAPEEFLASPEAQEATFRHRFGSYLDRYGNPQDAASAWFTGGPQATGANRRDQLGTTGQGYVDQFTRALGASATPSTAMGFTGEPTSAAAPPQMPADVPSPGRPTLPQGEVPQPMSPAAGAGAPTLPPEAQATVRALAGTGGAPPSPAPPTGQQLAQAVSPAMPGGQPIHGTFVPPEAFPRRTQYTPQQVQAVLSNPFSTPAQQAMVLQAWQQQQQPLSMPYKGVGTIIANPQDPRQQSFIPEVRNFKEKTGSIERDVPYTYDIRADRWVPVPMGTTAAPPAAPPAPGPATTSPSGGAVAGRAPFTGNAPGPLLQDLQELEVEKSRREKQSAEDVKQYGNLHTGLAGAGLTASDQLPYIQIAKGIIEDPRFYSGTGADAIMLLKRAGVGLGVLPPSAASPMEAFNKVMAANILQQVNSLRAQQESMGSQSGRIFQSQIELMEKAAQNPVNTIAANRYLTQLAEWSANRSRKIADMADEYKIKHGALDANFEKGLRSALASDPDLRLPKGLQFPEAEVANPPGALGTKPPPALAPTAANVAAAKAELARRQQQQQAPGGPQQP